MGLFGERSPRLSDVLEAQLGLPKSRKMVFFAPHTSERMATIPMISDLTESLRKGGVECRTHSIEDMRDHVISLSVQLSRLKLPKAERGMLERLLRLKDASLRLGLLCRILEANQDARLLEIHALDRDYQLADKFPDADSFYRLHGCRILFLRDFLGEYTRPFGSGMRLLETLESGKLATAAGIIGLDKSKIREQAAGGLGYLGRNAMRAALIKIPAPCPDRFDDIEGLTRFEKAHGLSMSNSHTLDEDEIAFLARSLM